MRIHRILIIVVLLLTTSKSQKFQYIKNFPMDAFYNFSDHSTIDSYFDWRCYRTKDIPLNKLDPPDLLTPPCCDCDKDCWRYGTCCIDFLWDEMKSIKVDEYLEAYVRRISTYKSTTCGSILPTLPTNDHEFENLYIIASCPTTATKRDVELCHNALQMEALGVIPVLGNDTYLYKNAYCARCNGVRSFKYQTVEVKCVDPPNSENGMFSLNDLYNQTKCVISVKRTPLNQNYLKTCQHQDLSGNCSARDRILCRIYQGSTANGYKNYFCFKCSLKFNSDQKWLQCPARIIHKDLSIFAFRFDILPEGEKFRVTNYHQTFPIWNFLDIPTSFTLLQNEGFDQYLCSGKRRKCCDCSRDCMSNKRCCVDVLWNDTKPVDVETYKKILIREGEKVKDHVCLPVYSPALGTNYTVKYRKLVRSCRRNANKQDRQNCLFPASSESPSMVVPVFGSDGFTYANSFCAKCNLVGYTYVNFTLKCKNNDLLMEEGSTNNTNKTLGFDDVYNKFSVCVLDITNETLKAEACSADTSTTNPLCSYRNPLYYLCKSYYGVLGMYSNFHCRSCVTKDPISKFDISYCDPGSSTICNIRNCFVLTTVTPISPRFRFSLILSFTDDTANLNYHDDFHGPLKSNCGKGRYFDIKQSKCIEIYCPPMYVVSGLDCVPVETPKIPKLHKKLTNKEYFLYFEFNNGTLNQLSFQIQNLTFHVFYENRNSTIFRSNEPVNLRNMDKLMWNLQSYFISGDFLIGINIQKSLITPDYGLDFSRFHRHNKLCAKPVIIPSQIITQFNSTTVVYQNKTFNVSGLSHWISFHEKKPVYHYSACYQFHLTEPCLRQLIPASQITKLDNMIIKHSISDRVGNVYKADQYLPIDKGYYVCLNKTNLLLKSTRNTNHYREVVLDVEYYITIIGISISMVCYVCIVLTYLMFKDLHTTAGLNNCFMCLSLLIADVMALSSMKASENTTACFIVAVIMHWSLLAAFSWTLVIAFDLVSRFGSFTLHSNENVAKKMVHRSLVGFLMPAVVVSIAVAIDESNAIEVGYGYAQICWRVNNLYARTALYIVPTALVTLIALTSLCFTIRKISKDKKSTQKHLGSKDNSKLTMIKMAIKLCVILGLTEIFGYIQIPDPKNKEIDINVAFGFIYAVLRSFRGLMLWFVYIYGRSVRKLYRKQYRKSVCRLPRKKYAFSAGSANVPTTIFTNTDSPLSGSREILALHKM